LWFPYQEERKPNERCQRRVRRNAQDTRLRLVRSRRTDAELNRRRDPQRIALRSKLSRKDATRERLEAAVVRNRQAIKSDQRIEDDLPEP